LVQSSFFWTHLKPTVPLILPVPPVGISSASFFLLLKSFSWFEQVLGFEVYVPERLVDQAVVRLVVSDGKDGVSLDGVQPQLQIVESYFRKKKM
jgi:hypothetical protein